MNPILERILKHKVIFNGISELPLHSSMDENECAMIYRIVKKINTKIGIETGLAYGVSALCALDAMVSNSIDAKHYVIDPNQITGVWQGVGVRNLLEAGFSKNFELIERGSEFALPDLCRNGIVADVAIIDGMHTFDHALLDFFYINRLLRVGGVVILDDTGWPSLNRLIRYIAGYPCYRLFDCANASDFLVEFENLKKRQNYSQIDWSSVHPRVFGTATALIKIEPDRRLWNYWKKF